MKEEKEEAPKWLLYELGFNRRHISHWVVEEPAPKRSRSRENKILRTLSILFYLMTVVFGLVIIIRKVGSPRLEWLLNVDNLLYVLFLASLFAFIFTTMIYALKEYG